MLKKWLGQSNVTVIKFLVLAFVARRRQAILCLYVTFFVVITQPLLLGTSISKFCNAESVNWKRKTCSCATKPVYWPNRRMRSSNRSKNWFPTSFRNCQALVTTFPRLPRRRKNIARNAAYSKDCRRIWRINYSKPRTSWPRYQLSEYIITCFFRNEWRYRIEDVTSTNRNSSLLFPTWGG